jgi:hypothetical protein
MFTADLFERVVRTFIVTFVSTFGLVFAAPTDVTNAGAWKAAGIAAVLAACSAGGSAVLALITKQFGPSKATASMVPQAAPQAAIQGTTVQYAPTVAEPITDHAA